MVAGAGPRQWERSVRYRIPLKQFGNMGPSHAYTEETYTLRMVGPTQWVASVQACTPFVPMGKCFKINLLLVAEDSTDGGCLLRVTGTVHFHKRTIYGQMLITRPALAGMKNTYTALFDMLTSRGAIANTTSALSGDACHGQMSRQSSVQVRSCCISPVGFGCPVHETHPARSWCPGGALTVPGGSICQADGACPCVGTQDLRAVSRWMPFHAAA